MFHFSLGHTLNFHSTQPVKARKSSTTVSINQTDFLIKSLPSNMFVQEDDPELTKKRTHSHKSTKEEYPTTAQINNTLKCILIRKTQLKPEIFRGNTLPKENIKFLSYEKKTVYKG